MVNSIGVGYHMLAVPKMYDSGEPTGQKSCGRYFVGKPDGGAV